MAARSPDLAGSAGVLPPDWEKHPELVQALAVLVEGAMRTLRGQ